MFNKANPKILAVAFLVLLALVLVVFFTDSDRGRRSFRSELVEFDPGEIDRMHIAPKGADPFDLIRQDSTWRVQTSGKSYPAKQGQIQRTLERVAGLEVSQVVATSSDRWTQYEVSDSLATRIKVQAGDEAVGLRLGKLNFDPQSRSAVTYIRQAGDENVYGVNGFFKRTLASNAEVFMRKTLVEVNPSDINRIEIESPGDKSFVLSRQTNQWQAGEQTADSASVSQYLQEISSLKGNNFADLSAPDMSDSEYQVTIDGTKEIQVRAKKINGQWIIHSSLLAETYFTDPSGDIRNKLFVERSRFIK